MGKPTQRTIEIPRIKGGGIRPRVAENPATITRFGGEAMWFVGILSVGDPIRGRSRSFLPSMFQQALSPISPAFPGICGTGCRMTASIFTLPSFTTGSIGIKHVPR